MSPEITPTLRHFNKTNISFLDEAPYIFLLKKIIVTASNSAHAHRLLIKAFLQQKPKLLFHGIIMPNTPLSFFYYSHFKLKEQSADVQISAAS